mmetsp:Transcript_27352/g.57527  ORF Transcript_27352/g.57527 Transcript_27352/m.57527 type:complete len:134 (-) Transcript_27352:1906-2307(-)
MNQDRGLNAIIGVVFAFSLLWTLAVLLTDSNEVVQLRENRFQLIVNGTHYVLDTDALPDDTVVGEHVKVVHYISPSIQQRVSCLLDEFNESKQFNLTISATVIVSVLPHRRIFETVSNQAIPYQNKNRGYPNR